MIAPILVILVFLGWLIVPALLQERTPSRPVETPKLATLTTDDISAAIKDPVAHEGRKVEIDGQIAKDPEYDQDGTHLQIYLISGGMEADVIVRYPNYLEVTQGDFVKITGSVIGPFTGATSDGGKIETVEIKGNLIVPATMEAVLAPARATWAGTKQEEKDLSVTVDKVEFADSETRLYLSARNGGDSSIVIQVSNTFLRQGSDLYGPRSEVPTGYKELPVDLSPGSSGAGVMIFPPLDESIPVDFSLAVSGPGWEKSFDFALRP